MPRIRRRDTTPRECRRRCRRGRLNPERPLPRRQVQCGRRRSVGWRMIRAWNRSGWGLTGRRGRQREKPTELDRIRNARRTRGSLSGSRSQGRRRSLRDFLLRAGRSHRIEWRRMILRCHRPGRVRRRDGPFSGSRSGGDGYGSRGRSVTHHRHHQIRRTQARRIDIGAALPLAGQIAVRHRAIAPTLCLLPCRQRQLPAGICIGAARSFPAGLPPQRLHGSRRGVADGASGRVIGAGKRRSNRHRLCRRLGSIANRRRIEGR